VILFKFFAAVLAQEKKKLLIPNEIAKKSSKPQDGEN